MTLAFVLAVLVAIVAIGHVYEEYNKMTKK